MGKDFAWDKEQVIGTVMIGEKNRRIVKACVLKGEDYLAVTKEANLKDGWKPVGGWAEKRTVFMGIVDIVEKAGFAHAFGTPDANVLKGVKQKPRLAGMIERDEKGMPAKKSKK